MTTASIIRRLVASLCLALLAAAIPDFRAAVLERLGAPQNLPRDAWAGGATNAAPTFR